MNTQWMIYGANGYTGRLIAREAKKRGHTPIVAGRNREKVEALAQELGFESRVFGLEDAADIEKNLKGVGTVLHCAGPFSSTHKPMYLACLRTKTNYLDITGEIRVFERVQYKKQEILDAHITVIPGVGFDVVPSDGLAALLKRDMPDATHLRLGFRIDGGPSPGTMKTIIEGLPAGGVIRRDGKLALVKSAYHVRDIDFGGDRKAMSAVTIPWGDVSTAFHSTGIPNIEVYMALPRAQIRIMKAIGLIRYAFLLPPLQKALKKLADRFIRGDSAEELETGKTYLWGEVMNSKGERIERRIIAPNGYKLTADASIRAVERILSGKIPHGPSTPSVAFGTDFVKELNGVHVL